jgi:hypothetical protein
MTTKAKAEKFAATAAETAQKLEDKLSDVHYDVTIKEAMEAAKMDRRLAVSARTDIEGERQALKKPLLEIGRTIDDAAKKAIARIKAVEEPIDKAIKAEEKRIEEEKERERREEAMRVQGIQDRITNLLTAPARMANATADDIRSFIESVEKMEANEAALVAAFQERVDEGRNIISSVLVALRAMLEAAKAREATPTPKETPEEPQNDERPLSDTERGTIVTEPPAGGTRIDHRTLGDQFKREIISDLRNSAGIGSVQAENVLAAIARGDIRHVVVTAELGGSENEVYEMP